MSPRPYQSAARRTATDQTRARIVAAARGLLASEDGARGFSLDAVAKAAGVVRMTVYYQFGSKAGLLEALFDDFAERGHIERIHEAFTTDDPGAALDSFVATFGAFFDSDRLVARRLSGLAALDDEVGRTLFERAERRREGARALLPRIAAAGARLRLGIDEAVDVLFVLTSLQTFDMLAGESRSIVEIVPLVQRMVRSALLCD
ncbi:MAG TPA: helix-turn-helix domain-containing protein [Candidatus Elarobacter sp.]|jgi:AcrR family transcriptional regulator|nr:helix-turn-helix domain-containing protein [Candidatus Elarobacter sp.]